VNPLLSSLPSVNGFLIPFGHSSFSSVRVIHGSFTGRPVSPLRDEAALRRPLFEHEHEYEFGRRLELHRNYSCPFVVKKSKISVDIFQRIPLKGQFTLSAIALAKADSGPPRE